MLSWIVTGGYALVVAGWWLRHVLISLVRPLDLYVEPASTDSAPARVSVIIPARNERDRISDCLRSLRDQGGAVSEIIVVDDRSDDGTAEVARNVLGDDPRLRIERVDTLPAGWAGKAHACMHGAAVASAEWLLFADADCRFAPGGVAGAIGYACRHDIDFLSLWLAADHRTFWEHMLIPLCGALILYWYPPLRTNHPRSSLAFANGQFILVRRQAYERMGGHACARNTVLEDIPLATHAKQAGLRLRSALGPGIASVRMYRSFREIWNGWARIFAGALQRRWKLLASVVSLVGGSLLPSIGAPLAALAVLAHGWPPATLHATLMVLLWTHCVAVYSVSYRLWGLCHCTRRHLLLYPVSVVLVIGILLRAWWWLTTRQPIIWRGTPTGSRTRGQPPGPPATFRNRAAAAGSAPGGADRRNRRRPDESSSCPTDAADPR